MNNISNKLLEFPIPPNWQKSTTIDAHTAGEPLRIITSGISELPGNTMLTKRKYMQDHYDHLRKQLMWEPRGHADMYGCIITPPVTKEADFGVIFMHNEGYSSMCGHGIIALTKVVIEAGIVNTVDPITRVKIDSPAGLITATGEVNNKKVGKVSFHNVPSFVVSLDNKINIDGIGEIRYDLAFGGAYYAYVQAKDIGLTCLPKDIDRLVHVGRKIKQAVSNSANIKHPTDDDLSFLYGTIFIDEPEDKSSHSRNVCIFAAGQVDRSPTGTGVSGRLAIHYARNEIGIGKSITIESIIGSKFDCKIEKETLFGKHKAIIPEVSGTAFITGKHEFYIDTEDYLRTGFLLR